MRANQSSLHNSILASLNRASSVLLAPSFNRASQRSESPGPPEKPEESCRNGPLLCSFLTEIYTV